MALSGITTTMNINKAKLVKDTVSNLQRVQVYTQSQQRYIGEAIGLLTDYLDILETKDKDSNERI